MDQALLAIMILANLLIKLIIIYQNICLLIIDKVMITISSAFPDSYGLYTHNNLIR